MVEFFAFTHLEARGIPVRRVWGLAESHELLHHFAELNMQSTGDLQALCRGKGTPFEALHEHSELVSCMFAVRVWENLPTIELKRLCKHNRATDVNEETRLGWVHRLIESMWVDMILSRGIPVQRLARNEAEYLFREVLQLELLGHAELEAEYFWKLKEIGVPPELGAHARYHRACLTSIRVWETMQLCELMKDCDEMNTSYELGSNGLHKSQYFATSSQLIDCTNKQSEEIIQLRRSMLQTLFVRALCKERWEARGIGVDRLTVAAAIRVAERFEFLDDLDESELVVEYDSLDIARDADKLHQEDMLNRLRAVTVWKEMPFEELVRTCKEMGVQIPALHVAADIPQETESNREDLIKSLKTGMCLSPLEAARWEASGIPVKRLGTIHAATKVINRAKCLETVAAATLIHEYDQIGMPVEAGTFPSDPKIMIARLIEMECWRAFPLHELQRECDEVGASSGGFHSGQSVDEKKLVLIERLRVAKWADKWRNSELPIKQLGSIDAIVEVSRHFRALETMSSDSLAEEYASLVNLPSCAFSVPGNTEKLIAVMKRVIIWRALNVSELREECMHLGISFRVDCSHSAEVTERCELLERLTMASCANTWEDRGIPVKRILNISEASKLQNRWDELDKLGVKDLRSEYAKLGLSSAASTPKVLELLPRLRLASLWKALPVAELVQECRKLGILASGEDDHVKLWQQIVLATWGPPKSSSPRTDSNRPASDDTGPPKSELLQKIAKHFQTLELPASATSQDLKKAYRRLVLVHHPDKNSVSAKQASTEKFRELVHAYEALDKFMAAGK